jgi:hypothetical protein
MMFFFAVCNLPSVSITDYYLSFEETEPKVPVVQGVGNVKYVINILFQIN